MTIKELIEILKRYPEGATVHVVNKWGNWQKVTEVVPNTMPAPYGPPPSAVCVRAGTNLEGKYGR